MVKVDVNPGICGHTTKITIIPKEEMKVDVILESECEHIDNMSSELKDIDAYTESLKRSEHSKVLEIARRHCSHSGCPVPMSICKGIEVAMGVAEPQDVNVKITKNK